ncbi:hypothetical protein OXX79_010364 [Metschnikowia pulcherrima]
MATCATGYNNSRAEFADSNCLLNDLGNIQHSQLELSHQQILGRFSQLQEELSAHQQARDRAGHANAQVPVDSVTTHTLKYFDKQLHAYHQAFAQSLADATARSGQRIDDCLARFRINRSTTPLNYEINCDRHSLKMLRTHTTLPLTIKLMSPPLLRTTVRTCCCLSTPSADTPQTLRRHNSVT